jgi:hypothetical protein
MGLIKIEVETAQSKVSCGVSMGEDAVSLVVAVEASALALAPKASFQGVEERGFQRKREVVTADSRATS